MSDGDLLPCPRCGGGVKAVVDPLWLVCQNVLCGVTWMTQRAYEAECAARDLAGTRAMSLDADWLPSESGVESGLGQELESLVYLVRLETLRSVEQGLTTAIEGRDTDSYKAQGELKAQIERDVLSAMRSWIRSAQQFAEDKVK